MSFPLKARPVILAMLWTISWSGSLAQTPPPEQRCTTLLRQGSASFQITSAGYEPSGPLRVWTENKASTAAANKGGLPLPAHCLIRGMIEPYTGADGKPYGTQFELRLPLQWNGGLLFQGGGGLDGSLGAAIGAAVTSGSDAKPALARGFAVVGMDGGHESSSLLDVSFMDDQQAKLNYGYVSIGLVVRTAKQVVASFYSNKPKRTYFMGCSNGGREAMVAAERYPEEFDGVVAGNPAFNLSKAVLMSHAGVMAFAKISPSDNFGQAVIARALSDDDWKLLKTSVLKACDALDGVEDGMIFNHRDCRYDPAVLVCKSRQTAGCLSQAKVTALTEAFSGPQDDQGKHLLGAWPFDSGIDDISYRTWRVGTIGADGKPYMDLVSLSDLTLSKYFSYPQVGSMWLKPLDYKGIQRDIAPTAGITDAISTDLRTFQSRGGKILLFTGWSDPVFSPIDLTEWYEKLGSSTPIAVQNYARLFMVPGMNHCGGGPALDNFDPLSALVEWVEHSNPPESIEAKGKAFPNITRPICAYPHFAVYNGKGRIEQAASYVCQ